MMKRSLLGLGLALGASLAPAAMAPPALAQDKKPIRVVVMNDQNSIYSDVGGLGSVVAAKLAAEDFGGEIGGRKIEVIGIDHQNKPDIATALTRKAFEVDGADVIADGASSAAGLAMNEVARAMGRIYVVSGPAAPNFTRAACAATTFHFNYDTYALAKGTATAVVKQGGDTWFFVTADYAFGHALQRDVTQFVEAAGGKVIGGVKHPSATTDLSSFLLQAQSSKAKIIGLANAGTDTVNSLKQGKEFGIVDGGQNFAGLLVFITDVHAMGLDVAKGLNLTTSFYWNLDDETRKLAARFAAQHRDRKPTMVQMGVYSGIRHYLASVKATGSSDPAVIAKKMRETKVNDAYNKDVEIRADGRVLHAMHLMKVKTPAESKATWDYYHHLATTRGAEAFRPLEQSECPLVKK